MTGTPLFRSLAMRAAAAALALAALCSPTLHGQTTGGQATAGQATPLVTAAVDESHLTQLKGGVSPRLRGAKDLGAADESQPSGRLLVVLNRPAAQEAALQSFLQGAHDKNSAGYHKWLARGEFGQRFGAADSDIAQLTGWLESHGLAVAKVSAGKTAVEFSGTVGQVNEAFHTSIHTYSVNGETHHANATAPMIPAALSGLVAGVTQLDDFKPQPQIKVMGEAAYDKKTHTGTPQWTYPEGTGNPPLYFLAPEDVATQYDLAPVTKAGIAGDGQTIGIINDSNIDVSLVNAYRSLFGLPLNPPVVVIDGNDPGINSDAIEAYLDVENAGSIAPNATVNLYIAGSFGLVGDGGLAFSILRAVNDDQASVLSLSFGASETYLGTAENAFLNSVWEQAAAQGQTVIVSTGDSGSSDGEFGLGVNGFASTPWNMGAGGSDIYLSDYATGGASLAGYWSTKNDSANGSLQKAFPEQPWNGSQFGLNDITYDPVADQPSTAVGGGGGASSCAVGGVDPATYRPACVSGYAKPSWQVGAGVPNDSVRDLPDFSLFASNAINGVIWPICAEAGDCTETDPAAGALYVTGVGGTSASAPAMAGIMALVNEKYGPQGQANFVLYPLAAQYPAVFRDITLGSNNEPCSSYSVGVLVGCEADADGDGYDSYQNYYAGAGYDQASGLGTIDVGNLIADWGKISFKASATTLTLTPTTITHGETITATATVTGTGTPAGAVGLVSSTTLPNNKGLGAIALAGGTGQEAITTFPGGTYTVYGNYSGDGINGASQSQPTTITVTPEATALTFTPQYYNPNTYSAAPITAGSMVPYGNDLLMDVQIAGVSAAAGTTNGNATGTVTFTDGGTTLATVAVSSGSTAEYNASYLAVGNHSISVSYSGDASFQAATAGPVAFSVAQMQSYGFVATAPSAASYNADGSLNYPQGQTISATALVTTNGAQGGLLPTGSVTFQYGSNAPITEPLTPGQSLGLFGNWSAATINLSGLPLGEQTLTVTYAGDVNFTPVTFTQAIDVVASTLLPSTTTFVTTPSNLSNVTPGTTITGVATVTGSGTVAPTGNVVIVLGNFLQTNPIPLVPGTGASSTANFTFRAADLVPGDNQLSVNYLGDNNYQSSASDSVVLLDDPTDFSVQATTPAVTIASGSSGTATLSLSSFNGFAGAVTLICAPAAGLTCSTGSASPVTLTANGTATASLTIGTVTSPYGSAALGPVSGHGLGWGGAAAGPALALLALCAIPRKRRNGKAFFSLVALAALSAGLGCGSSSVPTSSPAKLSYNAKPGTYTVLVTGTSAAGTVHNTAITVTVQ
jgi:hypothetical protein